MRKWILIKSCSKRPYDWYEDHIGQVYEAVGQLGVPHSHSWMARTTGFFHDTDQGYTSSSPVLKEDCKLLYGDDHFYNLASFYINRAEKMFKRGNIQMGLYQTDKSRITRKRAVKAIEKSRKVIAKHLNDI